MHFYNVLNSTTSNVHDFLVILIHEFNKTVATAHEMVADPSEASGLEHSQAMTINGKR